MKEQEPKQVTPIAEQCFGNTEELNKKIEDTLFHGHGYKLIDK